MNAAILSRREKKEKTKTAAIPPLHAGDRLSLAEFIRRYEAMPHVKQAELIEGVVYMPSPVRTEDHGAPHAKVITWLGTYEAYTPGTQSSDNGTLWLDLDNAPQPDGFLRILTEFGGQSKMDEQGYIVDAPELVAEVSASTASYDLHDKFKVYRRNGVREYIVWRVEEEAVDWFMLNEGAFVPMPVTSEGLFQSRVFPGLWLDPVALVDGNLARVLEVLQQGIRSMEHQQFVERLRSMDSSRSAR